MRDRHRPCPTERADDVGAGELARRRRRRVRRALVIIAVVLVPLLVASVVLVQFPRTEVPSKVDAIVVLGPLDEGNMGETFELLAAGVSNQLALSVADGEWGTLCSEPPAGVTVTCFDPDPETTRGEAQEVGQLAAEKGWHSLAVVTWPTHSTRSQWLISRCYDGDLYMVDYPYPLTFNQLLVEQLYQTGALVKVVVERGC